MVDHAALVDVFADYARTIARRYEVSDVLYRLSDQVIPVLGVDGAGVSIAGGEGVLDFVSATNDRVLVIEQAQIRTGQGPCIDAYGSGDRVVCANLNTEVRWPEYRAAAAGTGIGSVAGIPMRGGGQRIGALNLYRDQPGEWEEDALATAQILADMASGYILNALTLTESEQLTKQLQHALRSRVVIEQAKGVIAERHGISPAAAFDRLRHTARTRRVKVHDLAQQIVGGDSLDDAPDESNI